MMKKSKSKKEVRKYMSVTDVRCPICKGSINEKWFNFRNGNVVEFVAECWQPNWKDREIPYPRHVFFFQIEVPKGVLVCDKGSNIFSGGNNRE